MTGGWGDSFDICTSAQFGTAIPTQLSVVTWGAGVSWPGEPEISPIPLHKCSTLVTDM